MGEDRYKAAGTWRFVKDFGKAVDLLKAEGN